MQCSNGKLWSWQSRGCHSTWITCLNAVEQKNIPYVILDWTASVDLTCPRHPTNAGSDLELEFGDQADVSSSLSCLRAISEQFFLHVCRPHSHAGGALPSGSEQCTCTNVPIDIYSVKVNCNIYSFSDEYSNNVHSLYFIFVATMIDDITN